MLMRKQYLQLFIAIIILCASSMVCADSDVNVEKIQILTVNDFHGALMEDGKNPGAAKLAAFIFQQKALYPDTTLILSAGDMFQGTMDSNLLYGAPDISVMNYLGFDAMALGNHEFDWGIDKINVRQLQANFPFMAANIIDKKTGKPVTFCIQTTIIKRGNVNIGLIGYATQETPATTNPNNVAQYSFTDPAATANKYARELRKQGADIIIVLSHMGSSQDDKGVVSGEAADFAEAIRGVDLIVSGHTHLIVNGVVNDIPIIQASFNGRAVGDIVFDYSAATHKVINLSTKVYDRDAIVSMTPNVNVASMLGKELGDTATVKNRVIGTAVSALDNKLTYGVATQTLMGEFVTDIMRSASGTDIAFTNIGGLRAGLNSGSITLGAVYQVLPFDNTIVTCEMTGSQVLQVLNYAIDSAKIGSVQFSGLKVVYDSTRAAGNKIVSVALANGKALEAKAYYKVATNDFMAIGGDGYTMFAKARNVKNTEIPLRDFVDNYIIEHKTIDVKDDGRLIVK